MPWRRLVKALLVAPLIAPAGYAIGVHVYGIARNFAQGRVTVLPPVRAVVQVVWIIAMLGVPIAYGVAFLVAAPIFLMLRRYGLASRWVVLAFGAALGVAVATIMAPQLRGELFSIPFPPWAGGALGLASAALFWHIMTSRSAT